MRYVLKNAGYAAYKPIFSGKKMVGRVYSKANGMFGAVIGKGEHVEAATEKEAFHLVCAKEMGFKSVSDLNKHNANVREKNKETKALMNKALDLALNKKDFEGFTKLLHKIENL